MKDLIAILRNFKVKMDGFIWARALEMIRKAIF